MSPVLGMYSMCCMPIYVITDDSIQYDTLAIAAGLSQVHQLGMQALAAGLAQITLWQPMEPLWGRSITLPSLLGSAGLQ